MSYDDAKFAVAPHREVNPALKRFRSNPDYSRFERDKPPPLVPSREDHSIWLIPGMVAATPNDGSYEREMEELFAPPLNHKELELSRALAQGGRMHNPAAIYEREERFEIRRMRNSMDDYRREYIQGESGNRRLRVLARRNIRKRWKKMGVWNPAWGIPCREPSEPHDSTFYWRWEWQHGEFAAESTPLSSSAAKTHPIASALLSRQGLRFRECRYQPPLSHLTEQTLPSEAVSFIASRPWFVFGIERTEWDIRRLRLPRHQDGEYVSTVPWLWQNRGDRRLNNDSLKPRLPIDWKWRHESPSPDHEDATWKWLPDSGPAFFGVAAEENIHLDYDAMELTPSEIDVLESLHPRRTLPPGSQTLDGSDILQEIRSPTREMPQSQAPEPETRAQPRRSPRFPAKESDAMPPKAPTETGNPSQTTKGRLSERISAVESPSSTRAKTYTPSTKPKGRPPNTTSLTQPPSGISKPTSRSKRKTQAKAKESSLPNLLTEDKQPPAKAAGRKTARATDKTGVVVQTKNTPPEKDSRPSLKLTAGANPSQKRKRGQHKKSDAQEPSETIVVQLNDSIEALGRDQTALLVGNRRSERVKDRERKKQKTT